MNGQKENVGTFSIDRDGNQMGRRTKKRLSNKQFFDSLRRRKRNRCSPRDGASTPPRSSEDSQSSFVLSSDEDIADSRTRNDFIAAMCRSVDQTESENGTRDRSPVVVAVESSIPKTPTNTSSSSTTTVPIATRSLDVTDEARNAVRMCACDRFCSRSRLTELLRGKRISDHVANRSRYVASCRHLSDRDIKQMVDILIAERYLSCWTQESAMGFDVNYLSPGPRSEILLESNDVRVRIEKKTDGRRRGPSSKISRMPLKGQTRLVFNSESGLKINRRNKTKTT